MEIVPHHKCNQNKSQDLHVCVINSCMNQAQLYEIGAVRNGRLSWCKLSSSKKDKNTKQSCGTSLAHSLLFSKNLTAFQ